MRRIAVLGSTGSIGKQALEVLALHKDMFSVFALCASSSFDLLFEQARQTGAPVLGLVNKPETIPEDLKSREWYFGIDAPEKIASLSETDDVLDAIVGLAGIGSVIAARKNGKRVLLANKETLVAGGKLIMDMCRDVNGVPVLLPVDSEHSAIFQCIQGEEGNPVERIWLTASGGPFRSFSKQEIENATVEQALGHPTWSMGKKITVDSASMFNKALEIIEARWLFDTEPERITVAVHKQSVVHSMVEFEDGAIKAQLGVPDMRVPILYAITYPQRADTSVKKLSFDLLSSLTFERPDTEKFPSILLAYDVLKAGGASACALNAANEIAANAFLQGRIRFGDIYRTVNDTLQRTGHLPLECIEDIFEADHKARAEATAIICKRSM